MVGVLWMVLWKNRTLADAAYDAGPYGITTTPDGDVYYASLAGSHIARIDPDTGRASSQGRG
jgi:streptogramin lyase